ncbi:MULTISPECIES: general stress protein [unclassified Paenibacillus]|uniref:general stress protein n=1 Tax=unclassified Paenibacillus TaxID=185978 RepID=UPI0036454CB4
MDNKAKLVSYEEQAIQEIRSFQREGYTLDEIYVLAHDDETTEGLTKLMSTNTVGVMEEGIGDAFANLFRSRGDQLRSKMQSLGLSKAQADHFEKELDKGKILVMVWNDNLDNDDMYAHRRNSGIRDEVVVPKDGVYVTNRSGPGRNNVW